jgi:hypothetical protein
MIGARRARYIRREAEPPVESALHRSVDGSDLTVAMDRPPARS